jgi:hypothetical protein
MSGPTCSTLGATPLKGVARVTGLEPATSGVTGQRSNQLSYTRLRGSPKRGALFMSWPRPGQATNASNLHILQHQFQSAAKCPFAQARVTAIMVVTSVSRSAGEIT